MLHLTRVIDRATGAVFVPPPSSSDPSDSTFNPTNLPPSERPNTYSLFSSAGGKVKGPMSDVRDVQERWVDERDTYDAYEKMQWRKEGEMVAREKEKEKRQQGNAGQQGKSGTSGGRMSNVIKIRERM